MNTDSASQETALSRANAWRAEHSYASGYYEWTKLKTILAAYGEHVERETRERDAQLVEEFRRDIYIVMEAITYLAERIRKGQ